jgi:NAD(P)-dependent dehydrogenase (short-subunit alcohol dehydrogenase family)
MPAERVALITGANGGAGTAITRAFLDAGYTVAGVSRKISAAEFSHPAFVPIPADLVQPAGAAGAVETAIGIRGRIDVMVHVMGAFTGGQPSWETPDAAWESMLDLNFRSALYMIRAVLPHMLSASGGRVIAIASRQALEPGAMVAAYSASKAALLALVRSLALEVQGKGITANAILPGTIDTPANRAAMPASDPSKWVRPEAIAAAALWLASDLAGEVNGAAIPVYGRL